MRNLLLTMLAAGAISCNSNQPSTTPQEPPVKSDSDLNKPKPIDSVPTAGKDPVITPGTGNVPAPQTDQPQKQDPKMIHSVTTKEYTSDSAKE